MSRLVAFVLATSPLPALGRHFRAHARDTQGILQTDPAETDPFAWLEDVAGQRSMNWVRSENDRTIAAVGDPKTSKLYSRVLGILESKERIPYVTKIGDHVYNMWQDEEHARGLWRRTTLEEYRKHEPSWETVLDLDKLGRAEGKSWVWHAPIKLNEGPRKIKDLVLLQLSPGGSDAVVVREFNLTSKSFVPASTAFILPESKTDVVYLDRDTLLVGTDFGPGSMTSSGYPRVVRQWRRGTDLNRAPVVFEGEEGDVSAHAYRAYERRGCVYDWRSRATSFYTTMNILRIVAGPGASQDFKLLQTPADAGVSTFADQLLIQTRSNYAPVEGIVFQTGVLVATSLAKYVGGERSEWTTLFTPTGNTTLNGFTTTRDFVVLMVLDAVKSRLIVWRYTDAGEWELQGGREQPAQIASLSVWALDDEDSNELWVQDASFLRPTTLSLAQSAAEPFSGEKVKALPEMFDKSGLTATQHWATSEDGTRVPYFLVRRSDSSGKQPTLLYGYGGFRIPQLPFYSGAVGALWLERGGAFALANIRGGGEFGPGWHKAAVKENRHKSFEDFAAIAQNLVHSGVTTSAHLGIMGGSNGGFLVGNMLVKYPQLFEAVVCQVPLLDMRRYNKLLAGASWMAEYGNPDDPKEWEFLRHNSPYHNIDAHTEYPSVMFVTSTKDDRVHPSHARKMAAKMQAIGGRTANRTLFYENIEGGHGGAADARQSSMMATLEYSFLWERLGPRVAAL